MLDSPFNDRWQADAGLIRGDRPGIVASWRRYPLVVIGAVLVGTQRARDRYHADRVLITSDRDPSLLGSGPLSHLRDVRDRLALVETPVIGYVYVRPIRCSLRTLWRPLR